MAWLDDVDPKVAALTNLVTLVLSVGTITWGAFSIRSSVDQLESFRVKANARLDAIETVQQRQENDLTHLETVQTDVVREIRRLRDLEVDSVGRTSSRSDRSSRGPAGSRVVEGPPRRQEGPEDRRPVESTRAALPGDKRERGLERGS